MTHEDCPGVPYDCDGAMKRITAALDGRVTEQRITELLVEFDDCAPCVRAFRLEVRIQHTLSESCHEEAPPELRARISEALTRIDLSGIEVTDL